MAGSNIQSAQFRGAHGYEAQIPIFDNQIKTARALAGFDQTTLAERSGVGVNTIRSVEAAGAANVRGLARTLDKIVGALESAGVTFLDEEGGGRGVRLRKRK